MAIALVDTYTDSIFGTAGVADLELVLPSHGPLDLVVVAIATDLAPRHVDEFRTFTAENTPANVRAPQLDAPGWFTLSDLAPLYFLGRFGDGPSPTLDLTFEGDSDSGLLEYAAASFSGATPSHLWSPSPWLGSGGLSSIGGPNGYFPVDGIGIAAVGFNGPVQNLDVDGAWTAITPGPFPAVALAYRAATAGDTDAASWTWTPGPSIRVSTANASVAANYLDLPALQSASSSRALALYADAIGDPPVEFTEVTYRADGTRPNPEPIITPAEPWATSGGVS